MSDFNHDNNKNNKRPAIINGGNNSSLTPKPPTKSRQSIPNLVSRRRILPSHDSGYASSPTPKSDSRKSFNEDDSSSSSDQILLNSPIESRPSSSLSKFTPLPQIGAKFVPDDSKQRNHNNKINDDLIIKPRQRQQEQQQKQHANESLSKTMSDLAINSGENNNRPANESILIGLRLPNGVRKEKKFSSRDTLKTVMEFALKDHRNHLGPVSQFTFIIMPNFAVHDLNKSIAFYKIPNRSMLYVIEKKLVH